MKSIHRWTLLLSSFALLGLQGSPEYRLVKNWPTLPDGMYLGHPHEFPMPDVRAQERAERETKRAQAIARGATPPPRPPRLQPGVSGVAIDDQDHIYVFNRGKHPVIVLDTDGNVVRSGAIGITGTVPHFIKVDSYGYVWVVDEGAHRVLKLDPAMNNV